MNWFEVDKAGLAKLLERRGVAFAITELLQNAWDEAGVTMVEVTLEAHPNRPAVELVVIDDAPDGFADLRDSFTLFAESKKKTDAEKRGRFNLGEKLVLALCSEATITSTTGGVRFDDTGRHTLRTKRAAGTEFKGTIKMTRSQLEEALRVVRTCLPPPHITTTINGEKLPSRVYTQHFMASLETEIADAEGVLRRSTRKTRVEVLPALTGEEPTLYELGIPVQQLTGGRWHVDIGQKVPLTMERDAVPMAYLQRLQALVLNEMHKSLIEADAAEPWVREAAGRPEATQEAVQATLDLRYGRDRVMFDPSDPESNKQAVSAGFTVVHGRQLTEGERFNLKRFHTETGTRLIRPAGQVFPTIPIIVPGRLEFVSPTPEMQRAEKLAHAMATHLLGVRVTVQFVKDSVGNYNAMWEGRDSPTPTLKFNLSRLGTDTFWEEWDGVAALIIHEMGHHYSGDHLSKEYYEGLCDLGARLARCIAQGMIKPGELGYRM
jgi:hypothetical protein